MSCRLSHPSVNFDYNQSRRLERIYPPVPTYSDGCINNIEYETLPVDTPMRKTILGPNSLKKQYEGPWFYPPDRMLIPQPITMYDMDTSMDYQNGTKRTYGFKLYPLTQRSPHEVREYSMEPLPMPNLFLWTQYHTITDSWGR
jgi:hypothetical protein